MWKGFGDFPKYQLKCEKSRDPTAPGIPAEERFIGESLCLLPQYHNLLASLPTLPQRIPARSADEPKTPTAGWTTKGGYCIVVATPRIPQKSEVWSLGEMAANGRIWVKAATDCGQSSRSMKNAGADGIPNRHRQLSGHPPSGHQPSGRLPLLPRILSTHRLRQRLHPAHTIGQHQLLQHPRNPSGPRENKNLSITMQTAGR